MAQISAIVLFLARAASLQRAKFRPESVRFFFAIWAKMKPQARKQNERVCLLSHSNSRSGPP